MNLTRNHRATAALAIGATVILVACTSSNNSSTNATGTAASARTTVGVTASAFTADFSAMAQLKGLAAQGKGKIAVLLPDTTTSARYEAFDRPYLTKAFQAAGLSASDF